jgi:hypothetical protein
LSKPKFNPLIRITAFQLVVLSFFPVAEADFSFAVLEAEPGAARAEPAALVQVPAWLPVAEAAVLACFELAEAFAADALAAELVAGAAAAELELVCFEPEEALAADALAVELVAGAAAAELELVCSEAEEALAADALAVELVAGAAAAGPELVCSELAVALAVDAPAVELVAGAAAAEGPQLACSELAEALAADGPEVGIAAEPVVDAAAVAEAPARAYFAAAALPAWPQVDSPEAGCDWAARALELVARRVVDWAERFAAQHWVAVRHWVAAVGQRGQGAEPERGVRELSRRPACSAEWVALPRRPQVCHD